jgi:5-formyltetrahydrofolate cyclo-ligase
MTEKVTLRRQFRALRQELSPEAQQTRDAKIQAHLLTLPEYQSCRVLYIYISKTGEVDTRSILEDAWRSGKIVAAPRCASGGIMHFYRIDSRDALERASFGLEEPAAWCSPAPEPGPADLCIVPGLAFDRDGHRLGYGKGFYDRFLANFPGRTVGLCPAEAYVSRLPREETDRPAELVITEQYIYRIGR